MVRQRLAIGLWRFGVSALFQAALLAISVAIAWWDLLPFGLSRTPLAIVTVAQVCVFAFWIANCRTSWWACGLSAIGLLGLAAGLRWFMDGMPIPKHLWLFATYPIDGGLLLVGMACLGSVARGSGSAATEIASQSSRIRFSIADLLLLTLMCSLLLSAILWMPPNLAAYEYCYDWGDTLRLALISAGLAIPATVTVVRLCRATEFRSRNLILTIGVALIAGVAIARLLGVRANPLWAYYALSPGLTALCIGVSLLVQRFTESLSCRGDSSSLQASNPRGPFANAATVHCCVR